MNIVLSFSIVNPGPRTHVTGLKAAMTIDSAIINETVINELKQGDAAAEVA